MLPDDYLTAVDSTLERASYYDDPEKAAKAALVIAEAQVRATSAVAAAIDRLAEAVEAMRDR